MTGSFITIGSTRIKKSNIKQFGVGTTPITSVKTQGEELSSNTGSVGLDIANVVLTAAINKGTTGKFLPTRETSTTYRKYLYVTTFQNDNHIFDEDQIDIDETIKILESSI